MKNSIELERLKEPILDQRDIINRLEEIANAYPDIIKAARIHYNYVLKKPSIKLKGLREANVIVSHIEELLRAKAEMEQKPNTDNAPA